MCMDTVWPIESNAIGLQFNVIAFVWWFIKKLQWGRYRRRVFCANSSIHKYHFNYAINHWQRGKIRIQNLKKKTKRKRHTTIQMGNTSKDNFSFRLLNSIFNYRKVLANLSHKYMAITLTVIPERENKRNNINFIPKSCHFRLIQKRFMSYAQYRYGRRWNDIWLATPLNGNAGWKRNHISQ